MTPKQLAEHWQISESEAKNISDFINSSYQLDVIPVKEKAQTLWQGVMYAFDPHNRYILMESKDMFSNKDQAILNWTNQMRRQIIPEGQAKLMRSGNGVPTDVCLALNPVVGYDRILKRASISSVAFEKKSFKQHD